MFEGSFYFIKRREREGGGICYTDINLNQTDSTAAATALGPQQ